MQSASHKNVKEDLERLSLFTYLKYLLLLLLFSSSVQAISLRISTVALHHSVGVNFTGDNEYISYDYTSRVSSNKI